MTWTRVRLKGKTRSHVRRRRRGSPLAEWPSSLSPHSHTSRPVFVSVALPSLPLSLLLSPSLSLSFILICLFFSWPCFTLLSLLPLPMTLRLMQSSFRSVSQDEVFPLRAPFAVYEPCITRFLGHNCDPDQDGKITLAEWGECLSISPGKQQFFLHK